MFVENVGAAFSVVLLEGLIFTLLSASGLINFVDRHTPGYVKHASVSGIGLFLANVGQ